MIGQTISHYKILEKLGEGGMGVVYKAHDTELDRTVALKFLPSYLTTDANEKERFYHEARAASALNHPNVTTIYEIKEHEGRLFLAMECVEGKTLKKLVEQDPLPIKRVLDLAIQACDGLAAAHEKGVVHRDIKSDNIMVTPKGQVKIMDFGLAKVKGATKLTKAGSTLGTAAYMSPEQAQGEEVDHRTDIFSFGVVLYEMLTGKLPFRGEHQAALMYSLINEDPVPIARFNDKVTPTLEQIILKALAKERDERYQHIDDMLADLRRERKNLEYAKAGYATVSTISQVTPPAASPIAGKRPGKSLLKYGMIAGAAVIVIAAFVFFNPFNFQISTQKSSAAPEKNTLAVMYFENIPDPEDKDHTGEMLTNLLTTSLFKTKDIEVISRERLYDIQKELGQTDSKSISPSMATKIAGRAGVSMMLLGSILQKQPNLAVTYRLIEVQSGKILSTQRLSGFTPERVFSLVDTLALLVKNDLNVTPSASAESKSIASVTTTSPEAYRSYLEGVELNNRFYAAEATAAFRRAIELDSNFAMAYYRFATVNLANYSIDEYTAAIRKAYALSGNVTERERLLIQATYAISIEKNNEKASSCLETLIQKYPREGTAYAALGFLYRAAGQYEKALATDLKALQMDSLSKTPWNQVAYGYALYHRKQEALDAIEHYLRLAPAEANPYDSKGDIYAMLDDRDSAVVWWNKALSFRSDFPSAVKLLTDAAWRRDSADVERYMSRAAAAAHIDEASFRAQAAPFLQISRGEISKARSECLKMLGMHRTKKMEDFIPGDLQEIIILDYEMHDYTAMVQHARECSDALKRQDPNAPIYGRVTLAVAEQLSGNPRESSKLIETMRNDLRGRVVELATVDYGTAIVMFEEGKFAAALQQMNTVLQAALPVHVPLYHHAVAQLKAGYYPEAISELKRLLRSSPIQYAPYDLDQAPLAGYAFIGSTKAHYWLGVAYEQQGNTGDAMKEYQTFVNFWKNADFPSVELRDAKARLAKLKTNS
jgi:eukaryotic-like serine/threonine-protein kinase